MVKELLLSMSLMTSVGEVNLQTKNIEYNQISVQSSTESPFMRLGGFDRAKVLDCIDGYVYYYNEIYRSTFTSESDLYLVHVVTEFTPGHVARLNGGTSYKDCNLSNAYVHLTLEQYSEDGKKGGEIAPKDFWPKSSSFTTTISSSFGESIDMVFSSEGGIEIGNGASLSAKTGNDFSVSLQFDESISTVVEDPVLSSQFSFDNKNEVQWSLSSQNKSISGSVTYTLDSYYLFEMSKDVINANRDSFMLTYEVMYQGTYKLLWWWQDGSTFKEGVRISCFL